MYSVVLMVAMTGSADLADCHKRGGGRYFGCGCAPVYVGCCAPVTTYGCAPVTTCGCAGEATTGGTAGGGQKKEEKEAPALTAEETKKYKDAIAELKKDAADAKSDTRAASKKSLDEVTAGWSSWSNKEKRDWITEYYKDDGVSLRARVVARRPARARLVVRVPANARLTIGGVATSSTSAERTFLSPNLVPGQAYYYTLEATYTQSGKPVVVRRSVEVRAGKTTEINLRASRTLEVAAR
jgi:uncharacterized protein (TIGR03000 family)